MTTRNEVLAMAEQAGLRISFSGSTGNPTVSINAIPDELERFHALAFEAGRKAEREECAKVCDEYRATDWISEYPHAITAAVNIAYSIRARSAK